MFLYAHYVLDEAKQKRSAGLQAPSMTLADVQALPDKLDGYYEEVFQRVFPLDRRHKNAELSRTLPLLQVVLAAPRPLTPDELAHVCGIPEVDDVFDLLSPLGALFPVVSDGQNAETVREFHKSVSDWLSSAKLASSRKLRAYSVQTDAGHLLLARACARALGCRAPSLTGEAEEESKHAEDDEASAGGVDVEKAVEQMTKEAVGQAEPRGLTVRDATLWWAAHAIACRAEEHVLASLCDLRYYELLLRCNR